MELIKKRFGYLQVNPLPSEKELENHYKNKYFQDAHGGYEKEYSQDEKVWLSSVEWLIVKGLSHFKSGGKVLDIGCGEGYLLNELAKNGYGIKGIDFSSFGIEKNNPHLKNAFQEDNIFEYINSANDLYTYDCISLMHVIEHVVDPERLLYQIKDKMHDDAIFIIRFPNDNSKLHHYIEEKKDIDNHWWLSYPEHISYFNAENMEVTLNEIGFTVVNKVSEHPIDFNLLNDNSNYIKDPSKGKNTHNFRVLLDNFLFNTDKDKYYSILQMYGNMGIGRSLTFFCKKSEPGN